MTNVLRFSPGQFYQGADEQIAYTINVSNWTNAPTEASFTIWEGTTNRSASLLSSSASGGATISGGNVTTPCILKLTAGTDYRCELLVEQSGQVYEGYFMLTGET